MISIKSIDSVKNWFKPTSKQRQPGGLLWFIPHNEKRLYAKLTPNSKCTPKKRMCTKEFELNFPVFVVENCRLALSAKQFVPVIMMNSKKERLQLFSPRMSIIERVQCITQLNKRAVCYEAPHLLTCQRRMHSNTVQTKRSQKFNWIDQ